MAAFLILLMIGLPWLGALCVWLTGDSRPKLQHTLAVAFSVAAGLTSLGLFPLATHEPVISIPLGGVFGALSFVPDGLGAFLAAVAAVVGSLAIVFSVDYMRGEAQLGRYYSLVLLFIGAMVGLVLTGSLLFLFVFWEITALCSYALISFYNDDPKAVAGGLKALIMTSVGGVGLLGAALAIYGYTGSYDISNFLAGAGGLPPTVLALIAFGCLIAAAAKSAQVPFHTWLPDAMEAPTPVSALIHAATMVNAGVYLLARFYPAFSPVPEWKMAVVIVGTVTALLAALMALAADDLKRVLAYSTVSQLGYMVYVVGVGGVFASQFHLLSHAVFKALLFLGAGAVIHAVGTRDMRKMGGLGKGMPFVRMVFVTGALALAGIPILNGFWSKELVLEVGLEHGPRWAYQLMLLGAGLTAFYTFRMVWMVFFGQPSPAEDFPGVHEAGAKRLHDAGRMMKLALGPLAAGALLTWLLAGPFAQLLEETLPYHHIETESTLALVKQVLTAPATLVALGVIALGLAAFWFRDRFQGIGSRLGWFRKAAEASFGFEFLNHQIVRLTIEAAESLRRIQTGKVNWNILGIIGGLILVLGILAISLLAGAGA
jgi:NADH-quinone oxidoreductase subunit L